MRSQQTVESVTQRGMAPGIDLPHPDLAPYTAQQVAGAVAAWPMRAAEELRSALIFRALARAAASARVPLPWPARFASAARDEVRHARLCAVVGRCLGAPAPRYDVSPVRTRLSALAQPLRRAATLLVVEVAIGETISASLFRAGRRSTVEPLSRAALTSILADEVRHRDLGWSGASALVPILTESQRGVLIRDVAAGFAAYERQNAAPALRLLQRGEPFDPAQAALGVLPPQVRVEAFYAAVEQLVLPKLEKLGLDGERAWRHRYRPEHFG